MRANSSGNTFPITNGANFTYWDTDTPFTTTFTAASLGDI